MDFMRIFSKYDVSSEIMMLGLGIVMILLMRITRPKRGRMFTINALSFLASVLAIVVHLQMLYVTCMAGPKQEVKFIVYYSIFCILYITILNTITLYIDLLSYRKRNMIKAIVIKLAIQTVTYVCLLIYPLAANILYFIGDDGTIILTRWHFMPEVCGIIAALCVFFSTLCNMKYLSKIVAIGLLVFCPFEVLILNFQFFFNTAYFLSFTYLIPFTIFFCLFHCNKFDPIVGYQAIDAMYTLVDRAIRREKKYVVIDVTFPQLKNREYSDLQEIIEESSSVIIRKIERFRFASRLYSPNIYTYSFFCHIKDEKEAEELAERIRDCISQNLIYKGKNYKISFKQTVICSNPMIKDATYLQAFIGFLKSKYKNEGESEYIIASQADYEKFAQYIEAEHTVLDIRAKGKIDDERVICYVQPIHSIMNNSFRTGESLMRMKVGDKMIFPDVFIPAAEKNNCIHALTLIMLNAVCKKIRELEENKYDFDGITVNCSTPELADPNFHCEVEEIVDQNGIDPHHLRLEITESLAVIDYNNIYDNMIALNKYGISFYLDDFGTGYSNLERIAKYPFKTIKFDKSILYSALEGDTADALIRSEVDFFRKNGFTTVVEGVEDESQYNYCKEVGFDYIQGYYFAKPQPINNIINYFD